MSIRRHTSRTTKLGKEFLAKALEGAICYHRIAGYFRSSIFELIGEELSAIPEVKIVCNSELDYLDFQVATGRDTAIKQRWNQVDVGADAILHQDRYSQLDALLKSGKVEIRIVPRERLFLHGKAGVITYPDGHRVSFLGSVNETRSAFSENYELIWEDSDPASADWVEEEFQSLWAEGIPLPDAILKEIERVANRREVTVEVLAPGDVPGAALAEAPIYRGGEQLQPWQRSFVTLFLEHREIYGKARLLLADEVGVGKTLSMAASALVSSLLGDGPVLLLVPSTLAVQWQIELIDKLGIPSAVWSSQGKMWLDYEGRALSPRGEYKEIARCPCQIAIVSTGLLMHQRKGVEFQRETASLLQRRYGCVILDEAHKARRRHSLGANAGEANNLLAFMREIAKRTKHLILGTATPIQTRVSELWDLLEILNTDAEFVTGDSLSPWRDPERAVPLITGQIVPQSSEEAWEWIRNPLPPPTSVTSLPRLIRDDLGIPANRFDCSEPFASLSYLSREIRLSETLQEGYFQDHNPLLRHVVLRKRSELEDMGLLEKVGVHVHPVVEQAYRYQNRFQGSGIRTNTPFEVAYEKAEEFSTLFHARTGAGGFMKSMILQRMCSSFASGRKTAEKMLQRELPEDSSDSQIIEVHEEKLMQGMSAGETECLKVIIEQLSRPEAVDSKLDTVRWFLTEFRTEGRTWLEHGCIIFSQYFDTTKWVAEELSKKLPLETIAVYAGAGKSGMYRGGTFASVDRDIIKAAVRERELRLVIATDAACEGLNLQTLGTLINVDLPWNPARLEQRLGRIRRFGQTRKFVDMLNLVYADTQDERVYRVLSQRLQDVYDIFGSLPDTIEDDWISDQESLKEHIDAYIHERDSARNSFSAKYLATVDPDENKWEYCATVLSRTDVRERLDRPWK